ncbi:hypothetical protein ACJMK2_012299 [Sinanodonta woodiana]|uniref:Uncharacterized protein n=1 Tax=Sinanodonta woodiana TaxID=1069815 RepID=A0ABD3V7R4_SINWO
MGHGRGAGKAPGKGTGHGATSECLAMSFCCLCATIVLPLLGLGLAKVTVGAVYLHDCNMQSMIPIFLIISGLAPILLIGCTNRTNEELKVFAFSCAILVLLFNIAWTIAGSVWVYPTWGKVVNKEYVPCPANATNSMSCNETVLTFAFAMVTVDWIFLGFIIFYFIFLIYNQLNKIPLPQ